MEKQAKKFVSKVGLRLRQLREERKWSLVDAERHGWDWWQNLQKIEAGKKNITLTTIFKLSKLYNVEPREILDIEDSD